MEIQYAEWQRKAVENSKERLQATKNKDLEDLVVKTNKEKQRTSEATASSSTSVLVPPLKETKPSVESKCEDKFLQAMDDKPFGDEETEKWCVLVLWRQSFVS